MNTPGLLNIGMHTPTKTDEFSEKFRTTFDPPHHFRKIMLRIFYKAIQPQKPYIHLLECPIPPLLVTKNTDLLSLPSHDDYHECWVNKYRSFVDPAFVIIIMGTEGEQPRSGGYPERYLLTQHS